MNDKIKVKIKDLPNKVKEEIIPPIGQRFNLNNQLIVEVTYRNVGKLKFTCVVKGFPSVLEKPKGGIISPFSEEGQKILGV